MDQSIEITDNKIPDIFLNLPISKLSHQIAPTTEECALVIPVLRKGSCCCRCILRFLKEQNHEVYRQPTSDINLWLDSLCKAGGDDITTTTTADDGFICSNCLSILQHQYSSSDFISEIKEAVDTSDYRFKHFYCSLNTPVELLLRDHSVWIELTDVLPSVYFGKSDIKAVKDAWKWTNGLLLESVLGCTFEHKAAFDIGMQFECEQINNECAFLEDIYPNDFCRRKNREVYTRIAVASVLSKIPDERFREYYMFPSNIIEEKCKLNEITCAYESVFIAGRYNKYSRKLSQTPWIIDNARKTESSIEELVCTEVAKLFLCKDYKFSSSGREDVDVRMLGDGRPFIIELLTPKRNFFEQDIMNSTQKVINESKDVQVRDLQIVDRSETSILKEGELTKTKEYSAICVCKSTFSDADIEKINNAKELVLDQVTPVRVLHRRNLATRQRTIHTMKATRIDESHIQIVLCSQSGTYIKEFIHGDFGRTQPNLGSFLGDKDCDILQLDVENINLDWPKTIVV